MNASVIRPGLLISLKSTLAGGVTYERKDLPAAEEGQGADVARWETTRVIRDPDEHKRATKARGLAVQEIRKLCSVTSFGLLCPESMESELDAAVVRARAIADEHNRGATHTKVNVYALKGRIASSDTEAARAIGQEVASMIEGMNDAIDRLDASAIRDAATKAREMSAMLSPELSEKVGAAVDAARKAARQIVKRVEKDGEDAAIVLADIQRGAIAKARMAFLDLDDTAPAAAEQALPAVSIQRFAGLADETEAGAMESSPAGDAAAAPVVVPFTASEDVGAIQASMEVV